ENAAGHVYIERVESGEYISVAEGTAWSQARFVPGDPQSFLVISNGEVQRRSVDDPRQETESITSILSQTYHLSTWDSTGTRLVLGTRDDDSAPIQWVLIDVQAGGATELPDLEGLAPLSLTTA